MGWRGRGRGGRRAWPGRGPFSYLPPWQRPGWLYGRGACWRLFPYLQTTTPTLAKEQEIQMLEEQAKVMQQQLDQIGKRLEELGK